MAETKDSPGIPSHVPPDQVNQVEEIRTDAESPDVPVSPRSVQGIAVRCEQRIGFNAKLFAENQNGSGSWL